MPSTITDRLNGLTTSVAVKPPCVAVASSNITLSGLQTVGGVELAQDDRVLVIGQTDDTENGIYIADSGDWTRAPDFDGDRDAVQGTLVLVRNDVVAGAIYELTTENPVQFGTSSITFLLRASPNINYDQTQIEIAAGVTPTDFAWPEGDMRRYATLAQGIAVLQAGARRLTLEADTAYTISSRLSLTGLSGFVLDGNGATVLASAAWAVASGTQMLLVTTCTDFVIEDLTLDANRANRTPTETTAHNLHLSGCQRMRIENVKTPNAVTDGLRLDATNVADTSTYCRDFLIINCYSDNAYRNGAGIINAWDGQVIGGAYTGANGVSPQCGFDVESNDNSVDPGNRSIRFRSVRFTGNAGKGLVFSSKDAAYAMIADGCYLSANTGGGSTAGAQSVFIGCEFDTFTAASATGIEVSASANARIKVIGCTFRSFGASAGACIDDGSTTASVEVVACDFRSVVKAIDASGARLIATDNTIDTCTGIGISIGTSTKASVKGNRINAATGRAIFGTCTNSEIVGNHCTDVASVSGGYIQAEGAGMVIAFNTCEAATAQATTIGIRANHDCEAVVFNRCVNLHTTQPYSIQGTESATTGIVAYNSGGSSNAAKSSRFALAAPVHSDGSRPAANTVPIGAEIWNTTDNAPNYSDGTNWRTAAGVVT